MITMRGVTLAGGEEIFANGAAIAAFAAAVQSVAESTIEEVTVGNGASGGNAKVEAVRKNKWGQINFLASITSELKLISITLWPSIIRTFEWPDYHVSGPRVFRNM